MIEVWPVIHFRDKRQVSTNRALARALKCAGVFVIAMDGDNDAMDEAVFPLLGAAGDLGKIGVNYLGLPSVAAVLRARRLGYSATWSDAADVTSEGLSHEAHAVRAHLTPHHPFFASVAFKTQQHEFQPGVAAHFADSFGFIPTTSGPSTGVPPNLDKMRIMRASLPVGGRLAIASGVTPANVASFLPFVTHVLISTGISLDFHHFDGEKLAALMMEVAAFEASRYGSGAAMSPSQKEADSPQR